MKEKIYKERYIFWIFFIPIELFIILFLIVPFLLNNPLETTDMAAHYFSAWYTKEYLFPKIIGWNPFHYLGFPQNQFYPPLFTLLTVYLSFIFPLDISFKILLSMSVLFAPLSFYYFARSYSFTKFKSSIIMLGMVAILFFPKSDAVGGDLFSTFNTGMVANALALPLLFFYMGVIKKSYKRGTYIIPSVLMAAVVLSHPFTSIMGVIFSLSVLFSNFNKQTLQFYLKHSLLAFMLSAFWVVPLLAKINYAKTVFIVAYRYITLDFAVFFLVAFIMILHTKYASKAIKLKDLNNTIILLLLFYAFVYITKIPIHLYRFNLYFILLIPMLLINFIKKGSNLVILIFLFCSVIFLNYEYIDAKGADKILIKYMPKLEGRIIVLGPRESPNYFSTKETLLPIKSQNMLIKGPYIDSSLNAYVIGDLFKILDPENYYFWDFLFPQKNLSAAQLINITPYQISLLNVNYIIAPNTANYPNQKLLMNDIIKYDLINYNLYKVSNSSLIEILKYKPTLISSDWHTKVRSWFSSPNITKIIVNARIPEYVGNGSEQIKLLNFSKNYEYIKFTVNSSKPVPILIKISYFPNWRAYVNGQQTPIYLASPYIMLIYGSGTIELKYEKHFWDYFGLFLTIGGVILLLGLLVKKNFIGKQ